MKEKKKSNKWNIILIILIIIVAILIIVELATSLVSKGLKTFEHYMYRAFGIETKEGNTIGNINNYGYMAEDNKYLYYMCPNKDGKYVGISKVSKKDLTGSQVRLIEGEWELTSINSYGDYIYFVTLKQNEVDENDNTADEVSKNGYQKDEILNDNEFNNYDYKVAVVGGKIYYIGEDECIWYMDLDGKNKKKLNDNKSGFEAINEDYILYNMPEFKDGEETSISYIMDRNGKNAREINGTRIFYPIIQDNIIYYLTEDSYIHKMDLDGKNDMMLTDLRIYNFNVSNDGIFFLSYVYSEDGKPENLSVYRMDLDGKNRKKIYTLQEVSNSLCLSKDWVFFLDSNDTAGYMEIISKDGKQKNDLYTINYSDYYYMNEILEAEKISENTTENQVSRRRK